MNDFDIVDVSDNKSKEIEEFIDISNDNTYNSDNENLKQNSLPKKDKFIFGIYISLIILVLLTTIIYFFGYELFKPIIKV